jgi:hypothetical protein
MGDPIIPVLGLLGLLGVLAVLGARVAAPLVAPLAVARGAGMMRAFWVEEALE